MTPTEYARHRGVARQSVYRALADGRIHRSPDGSLDPVRCDADWAANTLTRPPKTSADLIGRVMTVDECNRLMDELVATVRWLESRPAPMSDAEFAAAIAAVEEESAARLRAAGITWPPADPDATPSDGG